MANVAAGDTPDIPRGRRKAPPCDIKAPPKLLNAKQLAERLNISAGHAYGLLANGSMATVRIGRSVRVSEAEVSDYITRNTYAPVRNRLRKIERR